MKIWVAVLLVSCFLIFAIACVTESQKDEPSKISLDQPAPQIFPDVASVVEAVAPSVVLVRTRQSLTDRFGRTNEGTSNGSGIIFDQEGYILTNNHVVEEANEILVSLADRREREAIVIGTDAQSVFFPNLEYLPTLPIVNSLLLHPFQ